MKKIILIISMLMLLAPIASAVDVTMTADKDEVEVGDTFSVDIILDTQGENITTWAINWLLYSNANITNITLNDIWKTSGFYDEGKIDNINHKVKDIGAFITTPQNNESILLCTIDFIVTDEEDCSVEIDEGYLRNKDNDNFDITESITIDIKSEEKPPNGGSGGGGGSGGNGGNPPDDPPDIEPPVAKFQLPTEAYVNDTILLNGYPSNESYDYVICSYRWNIEGVEGTILGPIYRHKFMEEGTYAITLTVFNEYDGSGSTTKYIDILKNESYTPNQDHDNDTKPSNNNTDPPQNNTNQTDIPDKNDYVITSEPLLIILALAVIAVIILIIKYRREEE